MRTFRRRTGRVCSLFVILALFVQILAPLSAQAAPKPRPEPVELVEKRGARSRVFDTRSCR